MSVSEEAIYAEVKQSAYEYINWEFDSNRDGRPCEDLFNYDPVAPKRVFHWNEEDYQGSIFVVYEYTFENVLYYLYISSGYGSCSGCDYWLSATNEGRSENTKEMHDYIETEFSNLCVVVNKNDIKLPRYSHSILVQNLKEWVALDEPE